MENSIGNNLPRVKVQNQFSIKEIVYKFGPISRIEISHVPPPKSKTSTFEL